MCAAVLGVALGLAVWFTVFLPWLRSFDEDKTATYSVNYLGSPLADVPIELINRVLDFHQCCECGRVMGFSTRDGKPAVVCDNCDYWRPLATEPEEWDR